MPEPSAAKPDQANAGAEPGAGAEGYAEPEESESGTSEASVQGANIADAMIDAEVERQIESRANLGEEGYRETVRAARPFLSKPGAAHHALL
jgi:hypothetical protein